MNKPALLKILICFFLTVSTSKTLSAQDRLPAKQIAHTFYGLGDYGANQNSAEAQRNLDALAAKVASGATKNTTVLFLGNSASKKGFPSKGSESYKTAEANLTTLINMAKGFDGKTIFVPGDEDWASGLSGIENQEKYITKALGKKSFLPKDGCPIERIEVNEQVDLLILDSRWAIMDWNRYPGINLHCEIRTKEEFYVEVESNIKKSEGKTVLVAMHYPAQSYGRYGARFSFGINPKDLSNQKYKEFSRRLITIARQADNVVFLSAHDKNLQFFREKGIPMIIAGAGAKAERVAAKKDGFGSSNLGFTKITQFTDGSLWVSFFDNTNNYASSVFDKEIRAADKEDTATIDYKERETPQYVKASIYTEEELKRSGFYKALWGAHYRKDYSTKINAKTALLDTLYGGLKPLRKGGGHQTNSLRLINTEGREFALRSVKKSALRFIQYFLFKTEYLKPDVEETYFVQLLQDYWTTANPYGALTIGDLADAVGILHPNPELYYIPKQEALGGYNEDYGDKLYFIEERLTKGQEDVTTLGESDKIVSTLKLFEELRDKEGLSIDEKLYIRTRIFDNLIGDWDRHADQWKWAKYKREDGTSFYKPIPRDRDQVYSDFDGFILRSLTVLTPPLRFMQRYDGTYNSVKWYNDAGDDVDLAVLKNHTKEDWIAEARFIKKHITNDIIEKAFKNIPPEMDQKKVQRVKTALKGRLANIEKNAIDVYEYLSQCILVTGTDDKDLFEISRVADGKTHIKGYRFKDGVKGDLFWDVSYDNANTGEIWVYGLGDEDVFRVDGDGKKRIHIKIIGGNGNDRYEVENSKNIKVYDYKSQENTFTGKVPKMLSDNADLNTYYFKKHRRDLSTFTPLIGFDPDDGLGVGLQYNFQKNSLVRNPFTDDHHLGVTYFFQTRSAQIFYSGEFAHIFNNVNFGLEAGYSSSNFTDNFFGIGNDTPNFDDDLGTDFNRVRRERFFVMPSLVFRGYHGSEVRVGVGYESVEVERTLGRFIETADVSEDVFDGQSFIGGEFTYLYDNLAQSIVSKSGIGWGITLGYKSNIDNDRSFAYALPYLRAATKVDKKGVLVLASKMRGHINFGNDFEFYQGATLGDGDGLRGFRQERFTGKRAFAHSTDLRLSLGRLRNGIIPISMGVYGGFDYGRVWIQDDTSSTWHTSPGGGMYFSLGGFSALNLAYFASDDGGRFTFGLSLPF